MAASREKTIFKIIFVGDKNTSKTSIILRYVDNNYSHKQRSTIFADYMSTHTTVGDSTVYLDIWDIEGDRSHDTTESFVYRGSDAVVLTYDITNVKSLDNLIQTLDAVRKLTGNKILTYLVGAKFDLVTSDMQKVDSENAEEFANANDMIYLGEVSAKENIGIHGLFSRISTDLLRKKDKPGLDVTDEEMDLFYQGLNLAKK